MFKNNKKNNDYELIADVDAVIAKPVGFKLHGKDHRIEPITTRQFLNWSNSLSGLYELRDKKEATADDTINAYFNVIHTLCPTITKEDIEKCEQPQLAALYGLIFDHCMGRAHSEEYQKKKTIQMRESVN